MFSTKRLILAAALCAAPFAAGCGSNGAASEFAGSYVGGGSNDTAYYAVEATVADDGTVTADLYVYDGTTAPPTSTNYPGEDFGDVVTLTGEVDIDGNVTTEAEDGSYGVTGSIDADGIFTGTIEEDGLSDPEYSFIAAAPAAVEDEIAVACGEYEISALPPLSGKTIATDGDTVFVTNGTDVFGAFVSFDDTLHATFLGTLGSDMCVSSAKMYCQELEGTIDGDWDGDTVSMDISSGGGTIEAGPGDAAYTDFMISGSFEGDGYEGDLYFNSTENCYSWDWEPSAP